MSFLGVTIVTAAVFCLVDFLTPQEAISLVWVISMSIVAAKRESGACINAVDAALLMIRMLDAISQGDVPSSGAVSFCRLRSVIEA